MSLQWWGKSRAKNFGNGLQKKNQLGQNPCRKTASVSSGRKVFVLLFVRHLSGLPQWHFATASDTCRLSAHRLRSRPGSERWLTATLPPRPRFPAKLWCSLLVWMKSVGQVSVLIRAALLGDGDWQYHVLKRESSSPCLLRLNVIGCFWSQGYKMGGRPSCAPQCHFQRGLNSVSQRHTLDLRNVHVYVASETSGPISKACHERNIHISLQRYLKDQFFPFAFAESLNG